MFLAKYVLVELLLTVSNDYTLQNLEFDRLKSRIPRVYISKDVCEKLSILRNRLPRHSMLSNPD